MYHFKLRFSPDMCPGVGLLDHMITLFLVFKDISIQFSIVTVPSYMPTNNVGGFPFLHTLSSMLFVDFFTIAFLTTVRWHLIVTRVFFLKHGSDHVPPFSMPFHCVFKKNLLIQCIGSPLLCGHGLSLVASGGYSLVAVCWFFLVVAFLCEEHKF